MPQRGRPHVTCGSVRQDGDRAGPACRSASYLHGQAGDREADWREGLQVVQLLDLAIAEIPSGLVPLPDNGGVPGLGKAPRRELEGRVPAPGVGADYPDALPE